MNFDAIPGLLYSMSQWWWKENRWDGSMARAMVLEPWSWEVTKTTKTCSQRPTLTEPACGTALKERNPWNTPTESCESDDDGSRRSDAVQSPSWLAGQRSESRGSDARVDRRNKDPRVDARVPDRRNLEGGESSAPDVQTSEGRKAVRGDRRRQEQQRAERQKRLSILSWNAGQKRGKTANCVVGPFHMILVQEAETHCHDIVTRAKQQFHYPPGRRSGHSLQQHF